MSTKYAQHVSTKSMPQSEPIPDKGMVLNSAGGFAFPVDDWIRLDRFLVLGNEAGTYYASEQKLTVENADCVLRCLKAASDGPARIVNRIVEISTSGRAPKNDAAIFALALVASQGTANPAAVRLALDAMPRVCRTGTHLFQFAAACQELRGWGRALRRAIADWYLKKDAGALAYQVLKYQQRNGWSHRDLLRLTHPKAAGSLNDVLHWSVKGWPGVGDEPHPDAALQRIWAFERLKSSPSAVLACQLIREYGLTREMVPTGLLTDASVWEALLEAMPFTATLRNLATMTRVGLFAPLSAAAKQVAATLGDRDRLRKARIHPVAVLTALKTYAQGRGERGKHTWEPVPQIVDALDAAFYSAFANVEPTDKRWLLALDVSGSMGGSMVAGVPNLSAREASAALALVTAAVEPEHAFVAFTSNGWQSKAAGKGQWENMGYNNGISTVPISPRQRLDDVVKTISDLPMGGTDCALPMLWATEHRVPVDAFVVLTDNETWAGAVHPTQALQQYRQRMGIAAKLIVVGMTATGFSIADPTDAGSMDVVGFDANVPALMADFVSGGGRRAMDEE
ncbi:MAG TPA: TROVE domain-containing protein [Gemmataceae bacterium]|jgi:60 kDa SS-A/Ro ribonucleoprotein|nr:TROVE domain-containing protein [Gemmataceae bacterium]